MSKFNLATKNAEQDKIKQYLENNASEVLIKKINEGVKIVKDNKSVINKKDLDGFWNYAIEEARKQVNKNARGAIVEDQIVYSWAIHYFEEDSIEGSLFNEDGTEYKPQAKIEPKQNNIVEKPKNNQESFFDILTASQEKLQNNAKNTEKIVKNIEINENNCENQNLQEDYEPDILFDDNYTINKVTGEVIQKNENDFEKLNNLLGGKLIIK